MEENKGGNLILVFVLLIVLVVAGFFGSRILQKSASAPGQTVSDQNDAPADLPLTEDDSGIVLSVDSPENNATVSTSQITVLGITVPEADVSVNEKEIKADKNGNFSVKIDLEEGENIIFVIANDAQGNYAEKEIIVNLNTE